MSTENDFYQEDLCEMLFDIGAVKFGNFKLKLHDKYPDAPLSPIYLDLRMVQRFPRVLKKVVDEYCYLLDNLKFDLIAGIPVAAVTFSTAIGYESNSPIVTPRMETKAHGTGAKVDGMLESDKGKIVVLVDDLITRADSKIEAIKVIQEAGLVINDVIVLIDRNQGGPQQLEQIGVKLRAVLTLNDMLDYYLRVGKINLDSYRDIHLRLQQINHYQK